MLMEGLQFILNTLAGKTILSVSKMQKSCVKIQTQNQATKLIVY